MAYTPKLTYKGRPLVRCGNDIYYGSMSDPYVVYLQVLSTIKENGVDVADKVHIVLLSTDDTKPLPERIVRQANKVGLYNALSFGDIMLQGARFGILCSLETWPVLMAVSIVKLHSIFQQSKNLIKILHRVCSQYGAFFVYRQRSAGHSTYSAAGFGKYYPSRVVIPW